MEVRLGGLSPYADTLRIDLPERVAWQDVTALLNVSGARYYYVSGNNIGVRYDNTVEIIDFAAQCLQVVVRHFCIGVNELSIGIHDILIDRALAPQLADDIWLHAGTTTAPAPMPLHEIEARGSAPAYWPR